VITHQVPLYYCPSRRPPESVSITSAGFVPPTGSVFGDQHLHPERNGGFILSQHNPGALGDYACNIGTNGTDAKDSNGPFQVGMMDSGMRIAKISDGVSNTIFMGEKHVPFGMYGMAGWDSSIYNGATFSSSRSAGVLYPLAVSVNDMGWKFGSAHPGFCQFVYGDGSVRPLSTSISPLVLELLADIADGQAVPAH